jgi:cell division protein FtsB
MDFEATVFYLLDGFYMNTQNMQPTVFSKRFQTLARWVVVIVLWLIIGSIAIGKAGISNFMELLNEKDVLNQTIMELQIQNQTLEEKIVKLKTSPEKQARYLKENFGYIEQDEYIFQFNNKSTFSFGSNNKKMDNAIISAESSQ